MLLFSILVRFSRAAGCAVPLALLALGVHLQIISPAAAQDDGFDWIDEFEQTLDPQEVSDEELLDSFEALMEEVAQETAEGDDAWVLNEEPGAILTDGTVISVYISSEDAETGEDELPSLEADITLTPELIDAINELFESEIYQSPPDPEIEVVE